MNYLILVKLLWCDGLQWSFNRYHLMYSCPRHFIMMIFWVYLCALCACAHDNYFRKSCLIFSFLSVVFFLSHFLASFTVMCYNVLCDKYATRQLYGYCPSWALNWEYRKKGIMEEIVNCDADIISLQVTQQKLNCL